jgi:hypothetical protein
MEVRHLYAELFTGCGGIAIGVGLLMLMGLPAAAIVLAAGIGAFIYGAVL